MLGPWLALLGFVVGTLGTLVGAGGGFILLPLLFFLYPERPAEQLTAISLAIVFLNSTSGSVAYVRKGRVDFRSAFLFSLAALPGVVLGAFSTQYLSRATFEPLFAAFLLLVSGYLFMNPKRKTAPVLESLRHRRGHVSWLVVERDGSTHRVTYSLPLGLAISAFVGFISSLIGVGGGIMHVPALIQLLGFPIHLATATSHFILALTSAVGSGIHIWNGSLAAGLNEVLWRGPGWVLGAQLGAFLSTRIRGVWIIRGLALALASVGVRLIWRSLA